MGSPNYEINSQTLKQEKFLVLKISYNVKCYLLECDKFLHLTNMKNHATTDFLEESRGECV